MNGTGALITLGLFLAAAGFAGVCCWGIDRRLQRKQQDWCGENGMRGSR